MVASLAVMILEREVHTLGRFLLNVDRRVPGYREVLRRYLVTTSPLSPSVSSYGHSPTDQVLICGSVGCTVARLVQACRYHGGERW